MTFEGLGEVFEGYSAETCHGIFLDIFAHVNGQPSGGSCVRRPRSEDPIGMSGNISINYQLAWPRPDTLDPLLCSPSAAEEFLWGNVSWMGEADMQKVLEVQLADI